MTSFHGETLEDFLIDQCGMVTPELLETYEPHREWIENHIKDYTENRFVTWESYSTALWILLPDLPDEFR